MMKSVWLQAERANLLDLFQKLVREEPSLQVKSLKDDGRFLLASTRHFGPFSMIEKEHYFISGQLRKEGGRTRLEYQVRANATFQVLAFIFL